jgi:hypothetical protein
MPDNIPTNIIKNVPPFLRIPRGNTGDMFVLPDDVLEYGDIYLAQEVQMRDPIEQETGDNILI